MDILMDFLEWAWPRHLNPISWYIRPLFFLPMAYFAWKRRPWLLTATIAAMLSSFFWFPEPEVVNDDMQQVLDMERDLFADPTWVTWASLAMIPASIGGLLAAFWKRSLGWGLAVINMIIVVKFLWVVANSGLAGAAATALPYVLALALMNGAVVAIARWKGLSLSLRGSKPRDHKETQEA
ncbi:hypothetical protein [Salininema proteolyticum]|uniref:Uncharacterized protein n=1 Tax=Salininema proteolyticum TaxID=1607685 RepID=A0ABV8U5U8_9ACTN